MSTTSRAARAAAAKEQAAINRKLQEEARENLPINSLYICLFIRTAPPQPNTFHWSYYFHTDTAGGTKYHIQNLMERGWIADHGRTGGVFKSNFLAVVIQVGDIQQNARDQLDQIMRSHDHDVNEIPGVSCRVWALAIMRKLIEAGLVRCDLGIEKFEQECMAIGNQHRHAAEANEQPRPVVRSTVCR